MPIQKMLDQVGAAQTFIDVDSTIGFPNSGALTLYIKMEQLEFAY